MSLHYSILSRQNAADTSNAGALISHDANDQPPPSTSSSSSTYRSGRTNFTHGSQSRDPSVTRGRNIHGTPQTIPGSSRAPSAHPPIPEGDSSTPNPTTSAVTSATSTPTTFTPTSTSTSISIPASSATTATTTTTDGLTGLQRRLSNRHHRQTSVINGLQHSRNPSFNSPLAASPLSPESLRNAATRRDLPATTTQMDSPNGSFSASAHAPAPSIDSTLNLSSSQSGSLGSLGSLSSTSRAGRSHTHNPSINAQPDGRTPSEYAMHHLLNAFVIRADQKIDLCLSKLDTLALPVEYVCGKGADAAFDQLLLALAHVKRLQPKALVDSLMLWRQKKADTANTARKHLGSSRSPSSQSNLPGMLPRRHTEPLHDPAIPHPGMLVTNFPASDDAASEEYMVLDRQATISIFILCRGLIEVFDQSTLDAITPELAVKLEDIVFDQLKAFEPHQMNVNKIRTANWKIYGHLLGRMSRVDFVKVTSRFLQQLQSWQQDIATNTGTTARAREVETRIELLLLSMQHLRLSSDPAVFSHSCEFLLALAQLLANAHGPRIKQAYCAAFESWLLQIASRADLTQHNPQFKEFVDLVNPRINQMLTKMRHWSIALPASITLLCLAPLDIFQSQWMPQINALSNKLRDKGTRTPAMRAICQLTWAYLNRSSDSSIVRAKKTEDLIKIVLPPGKKPHLSIEPSMAEATLCFIRLLGAHCPDLCYRLAILPLVNPDGLLMARDLRIDLLDPEKITIGIRAFLIVAEDWNKGDHFSPTFPEFTTQLPLPEVTPSSPMPFSLSTATEPRLLNPKVKFTASTSPINTTVLNETDKAFYYQFCELLGKIAVLCDNAFGSSAALSEKLSTVTPKTPLVDAFASGKRDDGVGMDAKFLYYELLEIAIQALPRCLPENISINPLIHLLCTASAHTSSSIADAATRSLKAIAGQGYAHAQTVATICPKFIFSYDHQYSTMSDDGRLGSAHIESTLTLYLDLLQIWIVQLQKKAKSSLPQQDIPSDSNALKSFQLGMTAVKTHVEDIEAYGLFFLCSQSRKVRSYAIKVLETVLRFDEILGRGEQARIIEILGKYSEQILDIADKNLTLLERSRLEKDRRRKGSQPVLIELCSSENYYDSALWFKAFSNVIRQIFELCPEAAALSREYVCDRLALMLPDVERIAHHPTGGRDLKLVGRSSDTPINVFFDQWKLYLIMACVTLSSTGGQSRGQLDNAQHTRKTSRSAALMQDKLTSARALFSAVIPLLDSGVDALRLAVVTALGSINRKLYRTLLESLQYAVITCNDEAKARRGAHQRTPSSPSRSQRTDRMRIEVTCIYKLTAEFLRHDDVLKDEWILNNLLNYSKDLRLFLSDGDVHSDWRFSRLRLHYCGLVEVMYENLKRFPEASVYMSFESRKSAFTLMEEWCGYQSGPSGPFWPENEINPRSEVAKEKINLKTAALSAMASLCAGPVSVITDTNTILQFNVLRILSWIDSIFTTREDKLHEIGQRALKNLILHNAGTNTCIDHAIQCCYGVKGLVALESCFNVIADVLIQQPNFPISTIKVLGAVIFTLGHDNREIRIRSARLLRFIDEREQKSSNLQHFEISISDKTRAVYKAAQFEYSRRLAHTHPDLAFYIFSEFCLQFRNVPPNIRRSMVAAILPWLQTFELQVLPESNHPTDLSYMLLVNMVEITVRFSSSLHNEVQALWQALATGPYGGNVQLILDFIIELSLERREHNFVDCAKQIVVYLSVTPAGSKIFEHFLLQLAPKNMPNERRSGYQPQPHGTQIAYMADLEAVLPAGNRQTSFSLGQISLIFLVDLLIPPVSISQLDALKLLHAVFILWDHHTPTVQEHAREMLVHLIHILIIARIDTSPTAVEIMRKTESLVEAIRSNDNRISWSYGDQVGNANVQTNGDRVPLGMSVLAEQIVSIFSSAFDGFSDLWAQQALHWASVCPVRHLACRSFQVFRCTSVRLDSALLSDMLARLSNTVAEEHADYQTFSLEILTTLKVVIATLDTRELLKFPQLIWTTVACLDTIHEREFLESLHMLGQLADRFDFTNVTAIDAILKARPADWEGGFNGIEPLVYKGFKSSECFTTALAVLEKLASNPDNELIGHSNRLMFNVLAHLPVFLEELKRPKESSTTFKTTLDLAKIASASGYIALQRALQKMSTPNLDAPSTHISEILHALKTVYFPSLEAEALIFLLGLLTNAVPWFRVNVLEVLGHLIPLIDVRDPKITNHGADLISPLLRLLQTDLCDQALKVMDLIIEVNVTPLERHHLRMSMASGPARAIRKEYERTKSLYGIPESSGWSVPTPAILSAQTRNNVHHVFFTCSESENNSETPSRTPDIEFHTEEEYNESYFPLKDGNPSYASFDTAADISMGDIVNSLDSLDDFFEENDSPNTPTVEGNIGGAGGGGGGGGGGTGVFSFYGDSDHETDVYDQQTAPIISKSYNRSSSSLSFRNGLADARTPASHYHRHQFSLSGAGSFQNTFTSIDEDDGPGPSMPSSDGRAPIPATMTVVPTRPGLHARSITSPANQFPISHPTAGAAVPPIPVAFASQSAIDLQRLDETMSDSESTAFPNLVPSISNGGNKSTTVTPTSATDASQGFMRRGMRRLTGGKIESAKEKARLRAPSSGQNQFTPGTGSAIGQSPRMPKIPSEYLNSTPNSATIHPPGGPATPLSPAQQQFQS